MLRENLLFFQTGTAQTKILNHMAFNLAGEVFLRLRLDEFFIFYMKIQDLMAVLTYKMRVGFHMGIKPIGPVHGDLNNFSQRSQKSKVPVNGAQADIGKFFSYIHINGICGRVIVSGKQKAFD